MAPQRILLTSFLVVFAMLLVGCSEDDCTPPVQIEDYFQPGCRFYTGPIDLEGAVDHHNLPSIFMADFDVEPGRRYLHIDHAQPGERPFGGYRLVEELAEQPQKNEVRVRLHSVHIVPRVYSGNVDVNYHVRVDSLAQIEVTRQVGDSLVVLPVQFNDETW